MAIPISKPAVLVGRAATARGRIRWRAAAPIPLLTLAALPAVFPFLFIAAYGVNAPQGDQWDFIPLLRRFFEGRLTLEDLFSQYTEQRLFFPRIVMIGLAAMTRYNTFAEMGLSATLIALSCGIFFWLYRRNALLERPGLVGFLPVTWLLCSFRQWDSLLWGWLLQWYMVTSACLLSLALLATSNRLSLRFLLALICATVASFSMASGLLVWPVGLLQLLGAWSLSAGPPGRAISRMLGVWSVIGTAVSCLYLKDYVAPEFQRSPTYIFEEVLQTAHFFVVIVGSTLSFDEVNSSSFGLILIIICTMVLARCAKSWNQLTRIDLFSLSIFLFSLLFTCQIIVGRSWLGIGKAMESKYIPITMLGIISIYLLAVSAFRRRDKYADLLLGMLVATIFIGLMNIYTIGLDEGRQALRDREAYPYYLSTYRLQDDGNLQRLGHDADYIRKYAAVLEKHHLSAFNEPFPRIGDLRLAPEPAVFHIDDIDGNQSPVNTGVRLDRARDPRVVVSGWAVDGLAGAPASAVIIDIAGRLEIPARYGLERSEVAEQLSNPRYQPVGFRAEFATSLLKPGQQTLRVLVVSADGKSYHVGQHVVRLDVRGG